MNWRLSAAWLVVLALSTGVTWQIVNVADSRVSARPLDIGVSITTTASTEVRSTLPEVTTPDDTTTTSTRGSTATSPTTAGPNSTSATSPSPTTAPTTATSETAASWKVKTINSGGGTVIVRYRPGEVELQAAVPLAGFDVEIDDAGPSRVRVEFESDESDFRVEAEWKDGALDVEISGD